MLQRGDLKETLQTRARELFTLCDPEGKGFASRTDIDSLRYELPLNSLQLDVVFQSLDTNADGKLTLQEFTDGFGMFLGIDAPHDKDEDVTDNEEDDEILDELLDHLGARNLFTDEEYLREMWRKVRKEDPVMRSNFENFISKIAADLKDSARERSNLQSTLRSKKQDHESQVQSLYAEMEEQLRLEKEEFLAKEQLKERRLRNELETELQLKDLQLKELLEKHSEMEQQLATIKTMSSDKKHEKVKLQKDRDVLESRLVASERLLGDMKNQLALLRQQSLEEKRMRAQAAFRASEGIAMERENLVLKLQQLEEKNRRLQDEKDELEFSTVQVTTSTPVEKHKRTQRTAETSREMSGDASISGCPSGKLKNENIESSTRSSTGISKRSTDTHPLMRSDSSTKYIYDSDCEDNSGFYRKTSTESRHNLQVSKESNIQNNLNAPPNKTGISKSNPSSPSTRCKNKLNYSKSNLQRKLSFSYQECAAPTRVCKVVFVGDSGVGKTSILQRFCTDSFKSTFNATVGVDFQVKTVMVEGERIACQLWDTAGQERFRCMTHQYFRKADGIIVVYDVTCESSFRNVRNWIQNIHDGAHEGVLVLLIGNKIDLCKSDEDRVIRTKDGIRLADEYAALFSETSAKTGTSINESIEILISILKTKEDETMEQVLKLQSEKKEKPKKGCC